MNFYKKQTGFGMKFFLILLFLALVGNWSPAQNTEKPFGIVIHGGAGSMERAKITPEKEKEYISTLDKALKAGYGILEKGGASVDAVEAAIRILEDSPLFNAGKGAVFTADGTIELDSSIMEGKNLNAGAVASIKHIKNPVSLARLVMEKSPHVMMIGAGAELFAKKMGVKLVPNNYFFTKERWDGLQKIKKEEKEKEKSAKKESEKNKCGTVGAVALDKDGNIAAATSTGGMVNKKHGRVGDSPIIGAGTYANNKTCGVSATGYGEYFIRSVVAYDISALMEYSGFPVDKAANTVMDKVKTLGGYGGVIAMDRNGNITMSFNTPGMFRGFLKSDGTSDIKIFQ